MVVSSVLPRTFLLTNAVFALTRLSFIGTFLVELDVIFSVGLYH